MAEGVHDLALLESKTSGVLLTLLEKQEAEINSFDNYWLYMTLILMFIPFRYYGIAERSSHDWATLLHTINASKITRYACIRLNYGLKWYINFVYTAYNNVLFLLHRIAGNFGGANFRMNYTHFNFRIFNIRTAQNYHACWPQECFLWSILCWTVRVTIIQLFGQQQVMSYTFFCTCNNFTLMCCNYPHT